VNAKEEIEPIYRNRLLYELVTRLLYGRHHASRSAAIADLIPAGSTVLDLCCGPALLYHRYLRQKSVRYTGFDLSPFFVEDLVKRGSRGFVWDVRSDRPLPPADYVVIQGSLYFFLPDPSQLIDRMLASAGRQVIVSESIRNLSSSKVALVSMIAKRLAGAVQGDHPARFDEQSLDEFFRNYSQELKQSFKIPGGRDKIYVLEKIHTSGVVP
jgi:SAM-dependent methyltransferase